MSIDTYLVCRSCKVQLWVGQREHIYTAAEYLKRLNTFLQAHRTRFDSAEEHTIQFVDEYIACYEENNETQEVTKAIRKSGA